MFYRGADSTIEGDYHGTGLAGISPPWSDAWVVPDPSQGGGGLLDWVQSNPWLVLVIVGGTAYALSQRTKK